MVQAAAAPVQGSPTGQISVGLILVLAVIIAVMVSRHRQARRRTAASGPVHGSSQYSANPVKQPVAERYPEAEAAAWREAIRLDPDDADAHLELGIVLAQMERYGEAEAAYRQAIRLDPGNASAHNSRGLALEAMQRYPEAEAAYRQAIRLAPGSDLADSAIEGVTRVTRHPG